MNNNEINVGGENSNSSNGDNNNSNQPKNIKRNSIELKDTKSVLVLFGLTKAKLRRYKKEGVLISHDIMDDNRTDLYHPTCVGIRLACLKILLRSKYTIANRQIGNIFDQEFGDDDTTLLGMLANQNMDTKEITNRFSDKYQGNG